MKIKGLLSKNTLLLGVEKHEKKNVSSTSRHIDSTFKCSTNDGTAENTEEYTVTFFRSYREVCTDLCWNYTDHFDLSICTEIFCKGYDCRFCKGIKR